jgi:hypothetical protein
MDDLPETTTPVRMNLNAITVLRTQAPSVPLTYGTQPGD